jgi:hypothetical protein
MERTELLLSIQRALLGAVRPRLRSVSGESDAELRIVKLKFVYDEPLDEIDRECATCVATEVTSDLHSGWTLEDKCLAVAFPKTMQHLPLLAFLRCESD